MHICEYGVDFFTLVADSGLGGGRSVSRVHICEVIRVSGYESTVHRDVS